MQTSVLQVESVRVSPHQQLLASTDYHSTHTMHIAVIGVGAAGLAAARHVLDPRNGFTCELFEQAGQLGGTWVYTDRTGTDDYGFPMHSSMYQGLRTNLPKEIMGFPDFAIPEQEKSYLKQEEILSFLNMYADNFNLRPYIKFYKHVKEIRPVAPNRWSVTVIDVRSLIETTNAYDAIMVCNGHYNEPVVPKLPGNELFKGTQCHSHEYRKPEPFAGQKVLIIGAGPSGMDLALHISYHAESVILSHHSKEPINTKYPLNVSMKPDVKCITETGVEFMDDTTADLDIICYCTGYKYSFPFLHEDCCITVDDNHIQPLYKHMINIEHPTMCLIGIPFNVCAFQMFDLQVRYFLQSLNGSMCLPSKEDMYEDTEKEMIKRWKRGYTKRQAHLMGPDQENYYSDLAESSNIEPIAPVIVKLRQESAKRITEDLINFRSDIYKIVDKYNYVKVN